MVHASNVAPRCEDFALPLPQPGQVVINVLASAVHPRTRSGASGTHYSSGKGLPPAAVPGIDGVGTVQGSGELVYFLVPDGGAMAQQAVAERSQCVPLLHGADPAAIAAAMIPGISSWVALTSRVPMHKGQSVLVLGATGVAGRMAIQVAKLLGAGQVIAAGRSRSEIDSNRGMGADVSVGMGDSEQDNAASIAEAAAEVDIVLDYLWGSVTQAVLPQMLRRRRDSARPLHWVEIGAAAGDEVAVASSWLRKADLRLLGSGQGSAPLRQMLAGVPDLARAVADGSLRADVRAAPLAEIETWWDAKLPAGQRLVFVMP